VSPGGRGGFEGRDAIESAGGEGSTGAQAGKGGCLSVGGATQYWRVGSVALQAALDAPHITSSHTL